MTTRLRLAVASERTTETMVPHAFPRLEFARADSNLARAARAPFSLKAWETARFPTPLHAPEPETGS